MPVLMLAVASVLLLYVVLAFPWIVDTLESREIRRRTTQALEKPLFLLSIAQAFDPTYAVLWQAPIAALELIESVGTSGIPVAQLQEVFNKAAKSFPEIYDGCSFVQWVQFLEQTGFVSWNGFRVALTPEGKSFLKYRFVTEAVAAA